MRKYLNGTEFFKNHLSPKKDNLSTWNLFNSSNQARLITFVDQLPGILMEGDLTDSEKEIIDEIKSGINDIRTNHPDIRPDRLDMDIAITIHKCLKKLKWGRYHIDDFGMWRWLSINHFLAEVKWRWTAEDPKMEKLFENSKACYQRLVGERNRRIFPLWYFTIGERLYDNHFGYSLLEKLATRSKQQKTGGFGNLNNYLNDTKLISPNEHIAKLMSKLLLTGDILAGNDDVENAFKRYNAYKKRLLNYASDTIVENEVCILTTKKEA